MAYHDRTLSIPVPAALDEQLRAAASAKGIGLSEFAREALANSLKASGYSAPPVGRLPRDRRGEEILALPECEGRRELAEHLAHETSVTVDQARAILRAASPDPVGDLARDIVADYHAAWGSRR